MQPSGTLPGNAILDGPPPSPAVETGMSPGPSPNGGGFGDLVPTQVASNQLPPEMLTGMMQAGETISSTIDSFAQAAPDLAPDFLLVKDALQRALAKLLAAGSGPTAPTAPGPNFPGGGIDAGGMPLAS